MTYAKGIDVSVYQVTTPPLAGLSFLFARASIGQVPDGLYDQHIARARAAGLVTGAYHFAFSGISIAEQASVFLAAAGNVDLLAIDVEGANAPTHDQTKAFIAIVHAAGRKCGLYHSDSGFFDAGQDFDWVAKWGAGAPARHWDFHQYRGSPLDLDRYNGTDAQLRVFAATLAPDTGVDHMQLAGPDRAVRAEGGHGIFTTPAKDVANLIRNTTAHEVLELIGNESGFQCVWLGDRAGFIADADVEAFIAAPPPKPPDCGPAIDAAVKAANAANAATIAAAKAGQATAEHEAAGYHERLTKINGLSAV